MRRLSGVLLVCAILFVPVFSHGHGDVLAQQAPQKTTFTGDAVIQVFAINPDKTADYEQVLAKLKEVLSKSEDPQAKAQAAGWRVIKSAMPAADGTILYTHVISPVVKDADYSLMNNIYAVVKDPAEQTAIFNMYRGAFKQTLFITQGAIVTDLSK